MESKRFESYNSDILLQQAYILFIYIILIRFDCIKIWIKIIILNKIYIRNMRIKDDILCIMLKGFFNII